MTKLLEKAFEVATNLPPEQQDELATFVLDEISSEQRWDHAFAKPPGSSFQIDSYDGAHLLGTHWPRLAGGWCPIER